MRSSPAVDEALPALYLHSLSTEDFTEGLAALAGPEGAALSAATITRLLQTWQAEYATWRQRWLARTDYVYVWADGLYFHVWLEEDRRVGYNAACLVLMVVGSDGKKDVVLNA